MDDFPTSLAEQPHVLRGVMANSSAQWVEIADGRRLPTLARCDLLAYLAVHRTSCAWFRLKWLANFAALAAPTIDADDIGLDLLQSHTQAIGAGARWRSASRWRSG